MMTAHDGLYWERACQLFRGSSLDAKPGNYLIHNKNRETVKVGADCQVSVAVGSDYFRVTADGITSDLRIDGDAPLLKRVESLVRSGAPSFFLVSADLHRRHVDNQFPLILLVQPAIELTFSPDRADGWISYAKNAVHAEQATAMLAELLTLDGEPHVAGQEPASSEHTEPAWAPAEGDDSFLDRLTTAVAALQDHPDGKLTLTRAYERRVDPTLRAFDLYTTHARINGEYACSHFFCIRDGVFSVGTTPENVLEVDGSTLTVDVVAATCKASTDEEYIARELYENPKQVKEHQSSLRNRWNRYIPFCEDESIHVVQEMQVKKLRNVCHLHSVLQGELRPDVTIFDLMGNIFPLLGARPKELLPIADAEPAAHRYYGGIVGHLHGQTGGCFLNIRNALLDGDRMHAKVGVGVVTESDPRSELLETKDKLSGLLEAVRAWERSAPRKKS